MPGVVFLIVIPTEKFERELKFGHPWDTNELQPPVVVANSGNQALDLHGHGDSNLNINLPDNHAILRLEVELRDKNAAKQRRGGIGGGHRGRGTGTGTVGVARPQPKARQDQRLGQKENLNVIVPMEKVLEELLSKLDIDHVTWSSDRKGHFYHVLFPIQSGEPCETTLHCLTELGIGTKLNSSVSVDSGDEEFSKWNNFVDSIKSKLTVKQVVDGVRAGGSLSFDYLLLIVTADSLAALGLVENNAPNIVAAMLVSPLMGPVMSITFGAIIADRELIRVGFISLALGMFISILFGFIFGLILGTTEMPWGFNDWPTEEMRGRGNVRSLWMGVLWALTSGTGVAVALLQGSAGPLIGVAISASLLPPVVNCGLFWALACIWLIYPNIKMPHLKGEAYKGNSSYEFIYTNYLPTEFFINGIVSGLLTVINVICIFITAIIVLKIKEVAAPYTSSPDLRRFWETDIRTARKTNRSTMRGRGGTPTNKILSYGGITSGRERELETALEQALKEAVDDETFRKVKRMSYSSNAAGELTRFLPIHGSGAAPGVGSHGDMSSARNSILNADLQTLDRLVSALLEQNNQHQDLRRSTKRNRKQSFSQSFRGFMNRHGSAKHPGYHNDPNSHVTSGSGNGTSSSTSNPHVGIQHTNLMPTIMEQNQNSSNNSNRTRTSSWSDRVQPTAADTVRRAINSIANAPHRFSHAGSGGSGQDEENMNLTRNILE